MGISAATTTAAAIAPQLYVAEDGISLTKFPSRDGLSRAVTVALTKSGAPVAWTAHTSASWLTVTASGSTVGTLVLQANPAGVRKDTLYTTTVTVQGGDVATDKAILRVSLWVSSVDPATVTLSRGVTALAADPVNPWVYVSAGTTSVDVYNVYSGALVKTFERVAPTVGQLAVGSIGTQLFAVDTTNHQIIELDTTSGQVLKTFPLAGPIASDFSFAYARPHGRATLFAPGQAAIDVSSGHLVSGTITIGGTDRFYDPLIVAAPDGAHLAIVDRNLDPGSLYSYSVTGSNGTLTIKSLASNTFLSQASCQGLAITPDGSRVYLACGAPYEFDLYDGSTLKQIQTLPGVPYPNNAVIDSDGDFVGGVDGIYQKDDVFVYTQDGISLGVVPTTKYSYSEGQGNNLLVTSADSSRVISATNSAYGSQVLMFRTLP
jgi:hypothetical protein